MGPVPRPHGPALQWKSLLQPDGTPIEYSWKWNTRDGEPDVRYDLEPIGPFAGTDLDPMNQQAGREMLHRLAKSIPSVDLRWNHHFLSTLYDHDASKYADEVAAGITTPPTSSILIAAEFSRKGAPRFKTYFQPRKLGQKGFLPVPEFGTAIAQLTPDCAARTTLLNFLTTHPEGKLLKPFSVSVDNVAPEKSRLKWYFNTPHTSFASVREIMTLGGLVVTEHTAAQLADLHELIKGVLDLPAGFPEDAQVTDIKRPATAAAVNGNSTTATNGKSSDENAEEPPPLMPGYAYYFDIAPGYALPEIKLNIPLKFYGRDDLNLARSTVDWMDARGRGAYGATYLNMLNRLAEDALEETHGLQSFISCLFRRNGDLDITTYISAKATQ